MTKLLSQSPGVDFTSPGVVLTSPGVVLPTRRVVETSPELVKKTSHCARLGQRNGELTPKKTPSALSILLSRARIYHYISPKKHSRLHTKRVSY